MSSLTKSVLIALLVLVGLPAFAQEVPWPGPSVALSSSSAQNAIDTTPWPQTGSGGFPTTPLKLSVDFLETNFANLSCIDPLTPSSGADNAYAAADCRSDTANPARMYVPLGYQIRLHRWSFNAGNTQTKVLTGCRYHVVFDDAAGSVRFAPGTLSPFDPVGNESSGPTSITAGTRVTQQFGGSSGVVITDGWLNITAEAVATGVSVCVNLPAGFANIDLEYTLEPSGTPDYNVGNGSKIVLVVGDSISVGIQDTTYGAPMTDALKSGLGGDYAVSNQSCGGAVADDYTDSGGHTVCSVTNYSPLLQWDVRIGEHIQDYPTIVSLMIGTNDADASVSAAAYGADIQEIADDILTDCPNCSVVLHEPVSYTASTAGAKTLIAAYAGEIATVAASDANIYVGATSVEHAALHPTAAEAATLGAAMAAAIIAAGL